MSSGRAWIGAAVLILGAPLAGAPQEREAELAVLVRGFEEAENRFRDGLRPDASESERERALESSPWLAWLPRFEALAERADSGDAGVAARIWCLRLAAIANKPRAVRAALDALENGPRVSPALIDLPDELAHAEWLLGAARCEATLRRLVVDSPHVSVQATAFFALAERLADVDDGPEAARTRAVASELFATFLRDYAEAIPPGREPSAAECRRRAEGRIFELDHLQVGMPAPDVEARDLDGVAFRLSDYRGKVVVLDFWGLWCGPCVAMLPHLARIAGAAGAEPFALLGVLSDAPDPGLRAKLAAAGATWRQAVDGAPGGPWASRWNVTAWPTVVVIDAQGRIRARGTLSAAQIESWLAGLLAEAAAGR